jgi:hypothetical protein
MEYFVVANDEHRHNLNDIDDGVNVDNHFDDDSFKNYRITVYDIKNVFSGLNLDCATYLKHVIIPKDKFRIIESEKYSGAYWYTSYELDYSDKLRKSDLKMINVADGAWQVNVLIVENTSCLSDIDTFRYLLDKGADIHAGNDFIIKYAVDDNNIELLKLVVEAGVNINAFDGIALRSLVENGNLEIVKYLVDQGASINICNDAILSECAKNGNLEILKYLVDNGCILKSDLLLDAVRNNHVNIVNYLIESGIDINFNFNNDSKCFNNIDVLRISACRENYGMFNYLLDKGAKINNSCDILWICARSMSALLNKKPELMDSNLNDMITDTVNKLVNILYESDTNKL